MIVLFEYTQINHEERGQEKIKPLFHKILSIFVIFFWAEAQLGVNPFIIKFNKQKPR